LSVVVVLLRLVCKLSSSLFKGNYGRDESPRLILCHECRQAGNGWYYTEYKGSRAPKATGYKQGIEEDYMKLNRLPQASATTIQ
jgi:hypothetical protein